MANNIIQKVIKAYKKGILVEKIKKKIKGDKKQISSTVTEKSANYWYHATSMENKKVLFLTFQGEYTCNPKYICNEIIRQGLDWDLVWVVNDKHDEDKRFPKEVRTVVKGTDEYFQELYSAHIWVDNGFCVTRNKVKKRPEQVYIETLHGSLGIKRIGPEDVDNPKRNKRGYRCGELSTYCISNSDFETEVFRTSFWPNTEILKYGHARNDFLLTDDEQMIRDNREKIHRYFGIPNDVNIAMFAPTFREISLYEEEIEEIDFWGLKETLVERFGGEWAIICRTHARDRGKRADLEAAEGIYYGAEYPDMQELILGVEVGITDYSSWIFDYVLRKKPGFIYAPDLKLYDVKRGFYYPIETAPFPVATSNKELKDAILHFDEQKFLMDVEVFLQDKGCIDDGHASERIVEKMKEIIGE